MAPTRDGGTLGCCSCSLAGGPKHGYGMMADVESFTGVRLGRAPSTARSSGWSTTDSVNRSIERAEAPLPPDRERRSAAARAAEAASGSCWPSVASAWHRDEPPTAPSTRLPGGPLRKEYTALLEELPPERPGRPRRPHLAVRLRLRQASASLH